MDDRNEEFRRRLERISQTRAERMPQAAQRPAARPSESGPGFGIVLRILSYVGLPLVVFVVLPWLVLKNLPGLTAMLNLPTWSTGLLDEAVQAESRDFSVRFQRLGAEYGDAYLANAEAKEIALTALAGETPPSGPETPVKEVSLFDANTTCSLRRPEAGEKVTNVYVRGSGIAAPVRAIHSAELQEFLVERVGDALDEGKKLDLKELNEGRFSLIDVYLTDTSAPLYLVLQTFSTNTIWNLHAAPGVKIAHVAMISGGASGLAGDLGEAGFEAIRAADFGNHPEVYTNRNLPSPKDYDCMAWPYQRPNETWTAWQGSKDGNTLDGNLLFGQAHGYSAYEYWYGQTLGATPEDNSVITALARAAVVGPIPETPIAFPPQDGLSLRLMRHDTVFTGTPDALAKQFTDHYRGLLDAAAGGDIAAMTRPEIDLTLDPNQPKPGDVEVKGDESAGLLADMILAGTPWEQEFDAMIDMQTSNYERRVGFTQLVALEDLLKPGEAMPPEDQQLLYAMLRAPQVLERHCAETLSEIAAKCRVFTSRTQATDSGAYSVDVTLGYVPNYSLGALEKKSGWAFKSAFLPSPAAEPYDTPEKRKAYLRSLMKLCDLLRAERGNCVISTAGFYTDRPATFSGGATAFAAGWVSVYAPDNPYEEQQLKELAEKLWAGLQ